MPGTDIRIREVSFGYEDYQYRTPIKFGGVALDKVTLLNVEMTVETAAGQVARGFGSMPLGNVWAWPSRALGYADTLAAMKHLAGEVGTIYGGCSIIDHPIEITHTLEPQVFRAADELRPPEPMPKLAALVVASAFDAALHDAYGKAHGRNCYHTYGRDFLRPDLGHFLGPEFAGLHLSQFVAPEPQPRLPMYHLVGALDPLTPADVTTPVGDGLPETLEEWIVRDGLTHLKIKLNGDDQKWDTRRIQNVGFAADRAAEAGRAFALTLDFNERCPDAGYLADVLLLARVGLPRRVRLQYVEQPTVRDLTSPQAFSLHRFRDDLPVVIDESLLDLETLRQARDLGYTGVAFKACKGQTQTLLLAAAAQHFGLFRCVQDLTCVGASLIHSASLAAHIPGVAAIESNGRQYCPAANAAWDDRFPGVFTIRDGMMNTGILTRGGLGAS